ncbi:membrane hypothetical protein [Burkholderia sp. 8Y]|uniref:histidine kinase dimerization/phospho-acceptor domain-containing protein n=1 Tax=Burkholderia sp. 8Y TaxID=2653133 RepID=UPI0012EF6848|nr:histidine kinase dimerization/phospho-acceptor domain-containing protein [Burkholderia sp. 8Y]VXC96005.1 membrane hypothetical protein [Burkholderia sp. 8Y]
MIVRIAQHPLKQRLLFGAASTAVVLLAQQALTLVAHGRLTFLFISATLPLITVLFGALSGLLLLVSGIAFGALWMQPVGSFAVPQQDDQIVLLAYSVVGAFLVTAGQQLAKVARRAGKAEAATRDAADRLLQVERDARHRFDVALDSAGVPFCILTPVVRERRIAELRWDYLNEAAAALFNQNAAVVIGSSTSYVRPAGWDADVLLERLAPLAERRGREAFDVRVQGESGEQWFHVVAASLEGSVVAWFVDVTPRVRAERALSEADRRKDEFLATLAHELRNPLAPIRQVAEILEQPSLSEERRTKKLVYRRAAPPVGRHGASTRRPVGRVAHHARGAGTAQRNGCAAGGCRRSARGRAADPRRQRARACYKASRPAIAYQGGSPSTRAGARQPADERCEIHAAGRARRTHGHGK